MSLMRSLRGSRALVAALTVAIAAFAVPALAGATTSSSHQVVKKHAKKHAKKHVKKHAPKTPPDIATMAGTWPKKDIQTLHLNFGPFLVSPGQNNIKFDVVKQRPPVDGWVTSFVPNLVYAKNGVCPAIVKESQVPPVDVIHLHHGVWLVNGAPTYAAGEEKTRVYTPFPYAQQYKTTDSWALTYMIHNLTPTPYTVCLTYDIGFIPATSKYAQGIIPVHTQWIDVHPGVYPVFDVHKGSGTNGKFTYPDQDPNAYPPGQHRNQWVVPQDSTIVGMVGHLHPGGLYDSMYDTRVINGVAKKVLIFRSAAHYFEPAGAVSWDVAMIGTPPTYRVAVKKGDVISLSATYDSSKSSWYEAMGIMPIAVTNNGPSGGLDPFTHNVAVKGVLNHGHLAENDHHGGGAAILPNAATLANGPLLDGGSVPINNFIYGQGDLTLTGNAGKPPTVHQGQSLTFVNNDADIGPGEWHTITSCKAPCNATTGIAYPLANGPIDFDSGELGINAGVLGKGGPPTAGRVTWSTPSNLPSGTYNYFCRIHPFMRGSFRVLPAQ